jgi:hypothetical protein
MDLVLAPVRVKHVAIWDAAECICYELRFVLEAGLLAVVVPKLKINCKFLWRRRGH